MLKIKNNKTKSASISPMAFITPLPPSEPRKNVHHARERMYREKNTKKEKPSLMKKAKNAYKKVEKFNNVVQFVEVVVAIALIL